MPFIELEPHEWSGDCPVCRSEQVRRFSHGDDGSGFAADCPPQIGSFYSTQYVCQCCDQFFWIGSNGFRRQKRAMELHKSGAEWIWLLTVGNPTLKGKR